MKEFDAAVKKACDVFGVERLFPEQVTGLKSFISRNQRDLGSP